MKISIVTPSYNQVSYLEETIVSVISQEGVDLEYIVIDGGSTDGSVDIIRKYEKHINYWISEPDEGQSHAIKKGFSLATGDILCWLNSDDLYLPGVLSKVMRVFKTNPQLQLLYADYAYLYSDGRLVAKPKISYNYEICLNAFLMIGQPSSFWTRRVYEEVGGLNTEYQYCFDYDFYLRVGKLLREKPDSISHVNDIWSMFRIHDDSKTVTRQDMFSKETRKIRTEIGYIQWQPYRFFCKNYYLLKTLIRFYQERGFIPLSKGPGA